jgi:hypothetical protein
MRRLGIQTFPEGRVVELPWRSLQWTQSSDDEPFAVVEFQLKLGVDGGTARLRYDVNHSSRPTGPREQSIAMATTPCPFGGVRWWWICPATGRWVRKLYLPNGGTRFLSRKPGAYRLAYRSQRHGQVDRTRARIRRLYARLGADYNGLDGDRWPPKPKGMRRRTYTAICHSLDSEAGGLSRSFSRAVERLAFGSRI